VHAGLPRFVVRTPIPLPARSQVDSPTHGGGATASIARQILRGAIAGPEGRYQLAESVPVPSGDALAKAQPMEAYEPGKCPKCGAPIQMHLKRTQQRQ